MLKMYVDSGNGDRRLRELSLSIVNSRFFSIIVRIVDGILDSIEDRIVDRIVDSIALREGIWSSRG